MGSGVSPREFRAVRVPLPDQPPRISGLPVLRRPAPLQLPTPRTDEYPLLVLNSPPEHNGSFLPPFLQHLPTAATVKICTAVLAPRITEHMQDPSCPYLSVEKLNCVFTINQTICVCQFLSCEIHPLAFSNPLARLSIFCTIELLTKFV